MKNKLFLLGFIMATATSFGQNIRLNAYTAYTFDDKIDSYFDNTSYYRGTIKGGLQWGAGLEFMAYPSQGVELLYLRQNTKAPITYFNNGVKNNTFDLGINYIMLAGNHYFRKKGAMLEGFGGAMIGADIMSLSNPLNGNSTTKTKFAWGVRGGINLWATANMGIKFQAQLLSAVQSVGGGFYFGTGGIGTGLSAYSSMHQFTLGGGLVFNIAGNKK